MGWEGLGNGKEEKDDRGGRLLITSKPLILTYIREGFKGY